MSDIRFDVLTIGHLSRNKFWGEADTQAYRAPRCTCTLLRTGSEVILVDPSLPPEAMQRVLNERAGIDAQGVTSVVLTHFHGDHRVGIEGFPHASWFLPAAEHALCLSQAQPGSDEHAILARCEPVTDQIAEGIALLPTPGHCPGHASLMFASNGLTVVVAADAVMTRDFFLARDYYFNTVDPAAAVQSLDRIAALADLIIPGHDNIFLNRRDLQGILMR